MAVGGGQKEVFHFEEWVPITIVSTDQSWTSRSCHALLAPNLCVPILLGGLFLACNHIVIDHALRTCIDKVSGYDLLNPHVVKQSIIKPSPQFGPELKKLQKAIVADITTLFPTTRTSLDDPATAHLPSPIRAIGIHVENLVSEEVLKRKDELFKNRFFDLFPPDVPNVCDLPMS